MFTKQERLAHVNETHGQLLIIGVFTTFGKDNRFYVVCSCRINNKIIMSWPDIIKYGKCPQCRDSKLMKDAPQVQIAIQETLPPVRRSEPVKKEKKERAIKETVYQYKDTKSSDYTREFVISCILQQYVTGADTRGYYFGLTLNEFEYLITQPCHYCGIPPNRVKKYSGGEFWHLGIDRVHNHIGYVYLNCVSCCWTCNQMKRDMEYAEFLDVIRVIHTNRCN